MKRALHLTIPIKIRIRFLRWFALALALLAFSCFLAAQDAAPRARQRGLTAPIQGEPAPRLPDRKPDLTGVWTVASDNRFFGIRKAGETREADVTPAEEAIKPELREKYKAQLQAGKLRMIERDLLDSHIKACAPQGATRIVQQGRPVEIMQIPGRVILRYEEEHWLRDVWMDGRGHPKDWPPTWMGHSTGKWDGDTLVIDTVGMNDLTWLDSPGHPHSESLHVVERYTRVNRNALEVQMTFDDPEIYTQPLVTNKLIFRLMPNGEIGEWVACEDRIRLNLETDVCKITGGWEFEAYCNRRKKGEQANSPQPTSASRDGY